MTQDRYTILVVEAMKGSLLKGVQRLGREHPELGVPTVAVITSNPNALQQHIGPDVQIIPCDYTDESVQQALAQIAAPIRAVICRGDKYVQYLRPLVAHLPSNVLVSSEKSLEIATNKRLMRQAFRDKYPQITPGFIQINADDILQTAELTAQLTYPVIIKPASLASSIMIQKCDDTAQLQAALHTTFERLHAVYAQEQRSETPEVIVEEYLEGTLYSVDSYVLAPGRVYHTPLVNYVAAKQLGIDDFFLYKRTTPVSLPKHEVMGAQLAAEQAIDAAGLQYSSVHIELVRTAGGWKIIEIGPRIGRFRNGMYRAAYGIDHAYNDILVHLGIEPELVLRQSPSYCAAYSIYPETEGALQSITGLDEVDQNISCVCYKALAAKPGQTVRYARNGGHALYELIFANDSADAFAKECAWFEAHVKAVVTDT